MKIEKHNKLEIAYQFVIDALSRLDENKLELSDVELGYEIFEELDIENITFLHETSITPLVKANLISNGVKLKILELRSNILKLMKEKHSILLYRNDPDWAKAREYAHDIMELIHLHNSFKSVN